MKKTYGFRTSKGMRGFPFVGLGSRCGLIGRFRQICIFFSFSQKGFKHDMHHAIKCKGGEQC
jgi:hypothetical protein